MNSEETKLKLQSGACFTTTARTLQQFGTMFSFFAGKNNTFFLQEVNPKNKSEKMLVNNFSNAIFSKKEIEIYNHSLGTITIPFNTIEII